MKPTEPQLDLSVIVVSWNTRDLLAQCLESVTRQQSPDLRQQSNSAGHLSVVCTLSSDVWVIDNASSDGSAAMVRERFPQVHLIENEENVGFARANNQAIQASNGRYALLLNSDTVVQEDALVRMVTFMDTHPDAGILGANIINPDGSPQLSCRIFPSIFSEAAVAWGLDRRVPFSLWFDRYRIIANEFQEADWVIGAALMARRDVLEQVGLFSEDFFMYAEEIDLAYRAKKAGWKTYILRDARTIHFGEQSTKQIPANMKAHLFRSKRIYFAKHHGAIQGAIIHWIFCTSMLCKYVAYRYIGQERAAALWGETFKFYTGAKSGV